MFEGYNGTIFAYGQTASGKTFTMQGDIDDERKKGIIPRTTEYLFQKIAQTPERTEFTIKCSMLEIYRERVQDLLDRTPSYRITPLTIVSRTNLRVLTGGAVSECTERYVGSREEMEELFRTGAHNRQAAATGMNEKSSRSHSLVVVSVTKRDVTEESSQTGIILANRECW